MPTDVLFQHSLQVVTLERFSGFAAIQSRIHEAWARHLGSSLGETLRYAGTDCFETFAFPRPDPRDVIPELEAAGRGLYDARAKYMVDTQQGPTKTYSALKDPSCTEPRVLDLRRLHEAMDRAVLDAYGWTDIAVPPYCPLTEADKQALQAFEDEVIDRLYVLNAERAREEARLGVASKKAPRGDGDDTDAGEHVAPTKKTGAKKAASAKKSTKDQGKLF
jgi:hypothetical protein